MNCISVNERLPNDNEYNLIAKPSGCILMNMYHINNSEATLWIFGYSCDPTNWMPLEDFPE